MLNAEQILEQGLLKLENTKGKPAQVGYDLSLKSVNKVGMQYVENGKGGILNKKSNKRDSCSWRKT